MPDLIITMLLIVLLVFALILMYILRLTKKIAWLEKQLSNQSLVIDNQQVKGVQQHELIQQIENKLQEPILENEQVTKQLTVRTKHLQVKISELEENIEKFKNEQPEDKLYRRALKMVELGADVEEVMSECELPRAEAELLFSIHIKSSD